MRNSKLFRINLFLFLIAGMLLGTSCGKNKATTMKLIKTDGEVGVENEKGKSVHLRDNLGLYNGYNIDTQTKSFAWIDLDDTKLTKMDEKSDVDVTKDGKKLELVVNSGGLFFNVTKPLEEDESMEIRTSTTICGIRGTCGWVEASDDESSISLLNGSVETTFGDSAVTVRPMEALTVRQEGDGFSYDIQPIESIPEFVLDEISGMPITLDELLDMMEEYEIAGNAVTASSVVYKNVLGTASFSILVPKGFMGDDEMAVGISVSSIGSIMPEFSFHIGEYIMPVPDGVPQTAGRFRVWVVEHEDFPVDVVVKEIFIARSDAKPDSYGLIPIVQAWWNMSTTSLSGREAGKEVINEFFDIEYDRILEGLK